MLVNGWGPRRLSRAEFYRNGGFADTRQFRRMRGGAWHYYTY